MKDEETFDPALLAQGHEDENERGEAVLPDPGAEPEVEVNPDGVMLNVPPPVRPEVPQAGVENAVVHAGNDYEHLVIDAGAVGFEELLARLKARPPEVKLVLLLGYPTAGKTWFLQRLKWIHTTQKLKASVRKVVLPEPVWEGRKVERTDHAATHLFDAEPIDPNNQPDPKRSRRTFLIADLPGELFDRTPVPGGVVHVYERNEVTSLLAIADALIMMLPAEEVLSSSHLAAADDQIPTKRLPELQAKVDAALKASKARGLSKADRTKKKAALAEAEGDYASMAVLRLKQCMQDFSKLGALVKADPGRRDKPLPVFVALSRADQIVTEQAAHDRDPWDALYASQPELADHLQKHYLWSRVDFVTAFQGQAREDTRVMYSKHRYFGVDAVLEWIEWATDRTLPARGFNWLTVTRALRQYRQQLANDLRNGGNV